MHDALENASYAGAPKRALRFCMITTFYPPYSFGGDAVYVHQLANELAARGHHVEIIHCIDSYRVVARGESLRVVQEHPNIIIHRLKSDWGALSPLATHQTGYPLFKTNAIQKILARGFDVIHYHNISLVGGPKLLEMGDAVKLYTTHEYWLVCPTNVLFRYDGVACEEKKCLRCMLAYHRPPQWWRYTNMVQEAVDHLDMLIHPSQFSLEKHQAMGLRVPATVLPYFHTTPSKLNDAPPRRSGAPYFIFVGRLELLKGAHTLIPLFRNYPRARLVIIGEGSQLSHLKNLAAGCNNIEFTGWLDHSQLATQYRNAIALLVPSLCYEAGPLVVSEAYLNRTPIIGRHIGSIPLLLQETGGGVTYTDETSLRAAMDDLLDHPNKRDEMGERGYVASQRLFTANVHLARYFEIIETVREKKKTLRVFENP